MRSVAIVGEFCSGKTTLADYLVEHHDYTRVSFAQRLKEVAARVYNKSQPIDKSAMYEVEHAELGPMEYNGRVILQELGQVVKALDAHFWIRWLVSDIEEGIYGEGPFVSDDTRFPYEADALRQRGFAVVRLDTPHDVRMERHQNLYGRLPSATELAHPSEVEARKIEADMTINGTRAVQSLADMVVNSADYLRYAA